MNLRKIFGKFLYCAFGTWLPVAHCRIRPIGWFSKKFRAMCGKLILTKCGKDVNIYPHASFSSKVELGDHADIGRHARIIGTCRIGNDVIMGPDVLILTTNHASECVDIPIKYQGITSEKPVEIGEGSWICARTILLPGVHIGKHVIVGAGAVVSKDVPDYAVVVGNPARIVKYRKIFQVNTKERL